MAEQLINGFQATATVSSTSATSMTLATGQGANLPSSGGNFRAILFSGASKEIVLCTGVSGDVVTIIRAWEGTTAISGTGLTVVFGWTAGGMNAYASRSSLLSKLQKWRPALRKVQTGAGDAKLLMAGDSTTTAYLSGNSSFPILGAPSTRLVNLFNSRGYVAAQGLGIPPTGVGNIPDGRWVVDGNWAVINAGFGTNSTYENASGTIGSGLVYTPTGGASYDSFDLYYFQGTALANFTATATGATAVTVNANGAAGIVKTTITALIASTSNTLTIKPTSGNPVFIVGIEPFLSTTSRIRVANVGVGSSKTGDWLLNNVYGGLPAIQAYAPDLTIINLGINDSVVPVSVATYIANMQQIITAAQASGDVIIQTVFPSDNATYKAQQFQYTQAALTLAQSLGIPVIDFFGSINGVMPAPYVSDGIHTNALGYADAGAQDFEAVSL